jgi:hypothetical protein
MNVNEHFIVRSITKKLEFLEVPFTLKANHREHKAVHKGTLCCCEPCVLFANFVVK